VKRRIVTTLNTPYKLGKPLVPTKWVLAKGMMDDYNFETTWGVNGQHWADSICQGDNFVVVINDPSSYIILDAFKFQ
jgi:hypothetical protein